MAENVIQSKGPVLLVADADQAARSLTRSSLERFGFTMEEAANGDETLLALKEIQPEIVLLDSRLPGLNSHEVTAALRGLLEGKHAAVLMMVEQEDNECVRCAHEIGAMDLVPKPIYWTFFAQRLSLIWRAACSRKELQRKAERNRAIVDAIPDLVLHVRGDGAILDWREPRGLGAKFFTAGLLGESVYETFFGEIAHRAERCFDRVARSGKSQVLEHQIRVGGDTYAFESRIARGCGNDFLIIARDVTERKKAEERIIQLAYRDTLTGLLNRHSLKDRLKDALAWADRYDCIVAVLLLGLDGFGPINDTLGQSMGDLILQRVADRIVQCTRKSDQKARIGEDREVKAVGRLGGDRFALLLTGIKDPTDAARVSRRLLEEISQPLQIGNQEVSFTASIGVAICPLDGGEVNVLLKNAEKAMHRAKEEGRNDFQFYSASTKAGAIKRLTMENELRNAMSRGEFLLHYQPQVISGTGRISGVEAKVFWDHPEVGLLYPAEFMRVAEETGVILTIGEWALGIACRQNKIWQKSGLPPIRLSVNLSGRQLKQENLFKLVKEALDSCGLDPSCLQLELPENIFGEDLPSTLPLLNRLKGLGLGLVVRGFGVGHSPLKSLKHSLIDVVKIDKSLVEGFGIDPDIGAITRGIIAMAHSMNLKVIAEGVESHEQFKFLSESECDVMQGELFGPPLPPMAMTKFLEAPGTFDFAGKP